MRVLTIVVAVAVSLAVQADAEVGSLMGGGFLGGAAKGGLLGGSRGALIEARAEVPGGVRATGSLFAGRSGGSLFAPVAPRPETGPSLNVLVGPAGSNQGDAAMVRDLISSAEAGRAGYDAVQHGARRKPTRRPTEMSVGEIYAWIAATPGQPHAIGRYQFIPSTLKRLVGKAGAGPHERFSPALQDRLADLLLDEAGLGDFRSGRITRVGFMNNLAKIWAGLPNSSGRSHYHGFAGNKATMSWASFDAQMKQIFPG